VSTVLVSLGVVAAAICVVLIALSDPDQPATPARPIRRAGPRRHPARAPEPAPVETEPAAPSLRSGTQPSLRPGTQPAPRSGPQPAPRSGTQPALRSGTQPAPPVRAPTRTVRHPLARALWTRTRSAMALLVLVTFTGVVLAALVGTGLAMAVRVFTRAVR
jgi:hypothetical protein